jgi:hypothetical protein
MLYTLKRPTEAFTLEDVIKYGIKVGAEIVDGYPWSFCFWGVPVTHETNESYIVGNLYLTTDTILVFNPSYMIQEQDYPFVLWNKEAFFDLYEPSLASLQQKVRDDMDKLLGRKQS